MDRGRFTSTGKFLIGSRFDEEEASILTEKDIVIDKLEEESKQR